MSAVAAFTTALAVAEAAASGARQERNRFPDDFPLEKGDTFPLPADVDYSAQTYTCSCGTFTESPGRCGTCEETHVPADVATLEADRHANIGRIVDEVLPEIGRLLLAALSSPRDDRRRRVCLRGARAGISALVRMVGEAELGPSASEDQSLTPFEFKVLNQGRDERAYGDYLVRRAGVHEESDREFAEERAHKENDQIDGAARRKERDQLALAYTFSCPACKAASGEDCEAIMGPEDREKEFTRTKFGNIPIEMHSSRLTAAEQVRMYEERAAKNGGAS